MVNFSFQFTVIVMLSEITGPKHELTLTTKVENNFIWRIKVVKIVISYRTDLKIDYVFFRATAIA